MNCFIFFALTLLAVVTEVRSGAEDDQNPELQSVLEEINQLIRDHYNIPASTKRRQPTAEALAAAEQHEGVRYSVGQAKHILIRMKRMWGYPVKETRIVPDKTLYWQMPIKFAFNGTVHNEQEKSNIRAGFKMWEDTTCIQFEEHDNADELLGQPHLFVIRATGCWSHIGCDPENQENGRQEISIGPDYCRNNPVVIAHEAGHTLGSYHEMSRPDRDKYVAIIWDNIIEGKEHNFLMHDDWDPEETGYDVSSALHYGSVHWSIDPPNARTIVPFDPYQLSILGQRVRLSFIDIKRINFAYGCIAKNCEPHQLKKPCRNGGYQDPKKCSVCRCPPSTTGDDCSIIAAKNERCGGEVFLDQCNYGQITLPSHPLPYGENVECSWIVKSPAKGLIFAFDKKPDMPYSYAYWCTDFLEIRTDMTAPATPGRFFCSSGVSKGRIAVVDNTGEALVRFAGTSPMYGGGFGNNTGFVLHIYATCNDTLASDIPESCVISPSGYESSGEVVFPICDERFKIERHKPPAPEPENGTPALHQLKASSQSLMAIIIIILGLFCTLHTF